jgi:ribosomal protein L37E
MKMAKKRKETEAEVDRRYESGRSHILDSSWDFSIATKKKAKKRLTVRKNISIKCDNCKSDSWQVFPGGKLSCSHCGYPNIVPLDKK